MGLQERIAARAAKRAAVEAGEKKAAEDAAAKKAIVDEAVKRSADEAAAKKAAKAEARRRRLELKPPRVEKPKNVVETVAGEPPDQTAAAVAQTDPELFRDAEARAKAAAEINLARKQWAEGPAKVLSR